MDQREENDHFTFMMVQYGPLDQIMSLIILIIIRMQKDI